MRLNFGNERSYQNLLLTIKILATLTLILSTTTKQSGRSRHLNKAQPRNLLQFSSPLMNTFSNYMQRANIQNASGDTPLKKQVNAMTETIQEAKKKSIKNFLNKGHKKKTRRKKKKAKPFLTDVQNFVATPSVIKTDQVQNASVTTPQVTVSAPVTTNEESITLSEDKNEQMRELTNDDTSRETQTPSNVSDEMSVASNPSELDNMEDLRKEEDILDQKKDALEREEDQIRGEEGELAKKQQTIAKAEQELKMEENNFNQQRAQEYQKIQNFEADIASKEQYLSTENQEVEQSQKNIKAQVDELHKKMKMVEDKQHQLETQLNNIHKQKEELQHERDEIDHERHEIDESKKISESELKTAKKEQSNIDHQNEDLQNRVQEVKSMRNQLNDLKDAYSVAFHKVVVHENNLKGREKMLQVAEAEVARQKADLAQKLIQFKNEYALLRSREQVVEVRMGDVVHREDLMKTSKAKRQLGMSDSTNNTKEDTPSDLNQKAEDTGLENIPEQYPQVNEPTLSQNSMFMKQLPGEINSLNKMPMQALPQIPQMPQMNNGQIPSLRGINMKNIPSLSPYQNMPMPNFGGMEDSNQKIFGGDSLGGNKMAFQPSKNLVNMLDKPKFLDDPYMKTKNFFKDEKLLI
jgi:hypothetical protein